MFSFWDRFLFWSDNSNKMPRIERSSLDGRNRRMLSKTSRVTDISIDYDNDFVYWCDAGLDRIGERQMSEIHYSCWFEWILFFVSCFSSYSLFSSFLFIDNPKKWPKTFFCLFTLFSVLNCIYHFSERANLDLENRTVLLADPNILKEPSSLIIFMNYLYWSDKYESVRIYCLEWNWCCFFFSAISRSFVGTIFRADKTNLQARILFRQNLNSLINDMIIFSKQRQSGNVLLKMLFQIFCKQRFF